MLSKIVCLLSITTASTVAQQSLETLLQNKSVDKDQGDEKLAYVFEVVRHGARTPLNGDADLEDFPVSIGLLTPEGMRQRFLLGRYNRQRYVDGAGLLSPDYNPQELYIQSTNVNRTMQSGYSELMGMYPPGVAKPEQLSQKQFDSALTGLPFGVRDAEVLNKQLGFVALPEGLTAVAIVEYNNRDINDDASTDGCPFINDESSKRLQMPEVWTQYDPQREDVTPELEKSQGLSDEYVRGLDFGGFQSLTDTEISREFQHVFDKPEYYTDEQWEELHSFNKYLLTTDYEGDASDLMITRLLRKPMANMQDRINFLIARAMNPQTPEVAPTKMWIYSAHDTQVTNTMAFLTQSYDTFDYTPYASNVIMEATYREECLLEGLSCFKVAVKFDDQLVQLPGCKDLVCTWNELISWLSKVQYSGPGTDIDDACFHEYQP